MLHQHTLQQLKTLRLDGMARAFEEQVTLPIAAELAFEDRFAQLVDRALHWRDNQRRDRLLKPAKLKQPQAGLEDLDHRPGRELDKALIASRAGGDWIRQGHALLIGGATGTAKTWLACALGQPACRQGCSTVYTRRPRLLDTLRIAHGDGRFGKRLAPLARLDVLSLDDWGLTPLDPTARHALLEVIDDRIHGHATIITSQLPFEHWHAWLNAPTLADASLDRLVHQAYRLTLKGESWRKIDRQNTPNENRS